MKNTKTLLHFLSLTLVSFISLSSSAFTPTDNYLLNCGSTTGTSHYNRIYVPDHPRRQNSFSFSKDNSFTLKDQNPPQNSPSLYHTARVFTSSGGGSYKFNIKKNGIHMVRLHFSPFKDQAFDLIHAKFGVLVNGSFVLRQFSAQNVVVKEFIVRIDGNFFEVEFRPEGASGFAFVNAIEVFSLPVDFVLDEGAKLVSGNGLKEFRNLSTRILETVHRINVGGSRLTPFNDSLWRSWIPDDDYLVLKPAAKRVSTTHTPNYLPGGASREVAPDNVYMTAQEMNKNGTISGSVFNITWRFPVEAAAVQHLVRLHFCDIVSPSLNQLYFDVYINGYSACKDLDLSVLTVRVLAAPIYMDFVADSNSSGTMSISVGPSALSSTVRINAILNGVEIMKIMNNEGLNTKTKRINIWIVVGSVVGGIIVLFLVVLAVFLACTCRRKKSRSRAAESVGWTPLRTYGGSTSRTSEGTAYTSSGPNGYHGLKIPFADIQLATNNFDKSLIIGSGGFGMVFKGVLKDNTKVAVKRGMPGSRQGLPEFQTEITILSKIRHRHLVSLVGYCEEQSEMILVYEYMEKGPLKSHLYGPQHSPLSWKQRLDICIGAARGLHYLHTGSAQGIIHRDIKSTNILLDENYVSKVADFGLSRSGPRLDETHVSTRVKGSFGYLDPEYFRRQQLTDKSDVYSFGVVLFEVLCARPAVDPQLAREQVNLAEWAMQWQKKGMLEHIIDPHLEGQIKPNSLKKFGETAEKCLAEYGVDRPTMGDVLWNLEYALQLQLSGASTVPDENSSIINNWQLQAGSSVPSRNIRMEREDGDGSSEINTSQVFSQLMTNEGR